MQKNMKIGIAVVVVAIVAIALYFWFRPVPVIAPGAGSITLPATGYVEHTQYYDIVANYATSTPLLASAGQLADATARSLMYGFIRDTITQFKTDGNFNNLTSEDIEVMGYDQGRKQKLQIVYLVASSPRTVSYIYTIYADTLGAHGNTFFTTFTFDTSSGASLALADVFTSDAKYLDTLSSMSRSRLPAVIGEYADATFIRGGTTPEEKNFANFFLDNREFVVLFDPYEVAPYAAGPQTLRIPLSQLFSLLKPAYR